VTALYSAVGAEDAGNVVTYPRNFFWQIWVNLGKFEQNLANLGKFGQIWAKFVQKLLRFGQNQNLTSSKTLDLLRL